MFALWSPAVFNESSAETQAGWGGQNTVQWRKDRILISFIFANTDLLKYAQISPDTDPYD